MNMRRSLAILISLGFILTGIDLSAASPEGFHDKNPKTTTKSFNNSSAVKNARFVKSGSAVKKSVSAPKKASSKGSTIYRTIKSTKKVKKSYAASATLRARYAPPIKSQVEPLINHEPEPVLIQFKGDGDIFLPRPPEFNGVKSGEVMGISHRDEFVHFSVDPDLQQFVKKLVLNTPAPHVAVVAMEPRTGRILAIADKSTSIRNLSLHTGFPAASLFKVVTTAAALERGAVTADAPINFRGGNYEVDRWNIEPDAARDRRVMPLNEALGRSCNPVFARVAMKYLTPNILRNYASSFGFNTDMYFQTSLSRSEAYIPDDEYEMGRTAAGFGEVFISPVHAAALMSGIANGGNLPRPSFVDSVTSQSGQSIYSMQPKIIKEIIKPTTAQTLLRMMTATTTLGTSRKEFMRNNQPVFGNIEVAAKTGTLRGLNPKGLNNWFIAAAPVGNPKIAISVIVVNPGGTSSKASHLGRLVLEKYLLK